MKEIQRKIIYCTYFDKGFLLKGLALYESLIRYSPNVELWILAFDIYTEEILKKMKLKGVKVIALKDFEDKDLLKVKLTRLLVEYIWTCTSSWTLYVLKNSKADYVVYLDSDLYFYSNPDIGVNEIKDKSLLVVKHNYSKGRENMAKISGQFNVAFNVFKNDDIGIKCLARWRKQCLDWCFLKPEEGKFGDQMYLDEWPKLYKKYLVVSKNIGLDVAPWNVAQYKISKRDSSVLINQQKLICYHFHTFKILGPMHFRRTLAYTLSKDCVKFIYEPYESELERQFVRVMKYDKDFRIEINEKSQELNIKDKFKNILGHMLKIRGD